MVNEKSAELMDFLKDNLTRNLTSNDIAEELGISSASVNGAFTAISNRGWGIREPAEVTRMREICFVGLTELGKTVDLDQVSDKGSVILQYLEDFDKENAITLEDLADALHTSKRSVSATFNNLCANGYCKRIVKEAPILETVYYLRLTEEGLAVMEDPEW